MTNGSVFAACINPLQHNQQRTLRLGIQEVLQHREPLQIFCKFVRSIVLLPAMGIARIDVVQFCLGIRADDEFL